MAFKEKGDIIYLLGESKNDISSSEYLYSYHKVKASPVPYFDLDKEFRLQKLVKSLIEKSMIRSAHDVSDGGLYVTLLESAMVRGFGFDITTDAEIRNDAFLFGEAQGRIVVSVTATKEAAFIDFMIEQKFPFSALGHVTKSELRVDDISFGFVADAKKDYDCTLESLLNK